MNRGVTGNDEKEKVIPCDALLIRGSCIINEAMLTGLILIPYILIYLH